MNGRKPTLDPSLKFTQGDESSVQPYASEPFGIGSMFGRLAHGLVGLDPRFVRDPRFDYEATYQGGAPRLGPAGHQILTGFTTHPTMFTDLDPKTVANDMWAIAQGHQGTSVGDTSSGIFKRLTHEVIGNSPVITPQMVDEIKQRFLESGYPEFRQQHPGKEAYTEK